MPPMMPPNMRPPSNPLYYTPWSQMMSPRRPPRNSPMMPPGAYFAVVSHRGITAWYHRGSLLHSGARTDNPAHQALSNYARSEWTRYVHPRMDASFAAIYVSGFDNVPTDPNERRQVLRRLHNEVVTAENATATHTRALNDAREAYLLARVQLTRSQDHEHECRQALDYYLEDVEREHMEDAQAMVEEYGEA